MVIVIVAFIITTIIIDVRNIVIPRMEVTIFCADLESSNQASSELIILLPISSLHKMRIDYQSLTINNS